MKTIILQAPSTAETRAIRAAAMLADAGAFRLVNATLESLPMELQNLRDGALPVGSVEFVRLAMKLTGIEEPRNLSYPDGCEPFLRREVHRVRAGSVIGQWFVKPIRTKAFNGFVFDTLQDPSRLDEHDREQYDAFMEMAADEKVLISEPVRFTSEWRYYVLHDKVAGMARYDQEGHEDAPCPNIDVVHACINAINLPHPYALDFGVLDNGESALIEANDGWAIGLYRGPQTIKDKAYLELLSSRWISLHSPPGQHPSSKHHERNSP